MPPQRKNNVSFQTLFRSFRSPEIMTARYVSLEKVNPFDPRNPHINASTITSIPGQIPRRHYQQISPKNPVYRGDLYICPAIKISCECPRFLYFWEYALWYHGAADIIYSNGEPPIDTNPQLRPSACKHLLTLMSWINQSKS